MTKKHPETDDIYHPLLDAKTFTSRIGWHWSSQIWMKVTMGCRRNAQGVQFWMLLTTVIFIQIRMINVLFWKSRSGLSTSSISECFL